MALLTKKEREMFEKLVNDNIDYSGIPIKVKPGQDQPEFHVNVDVDVVLEYVESVYTDKLSRKRFDFEDVALINQMFLTNSIEKATKKASEILRGLFRKREQKQEAKA